MGNCSSKSPSAGHSVIELRKNAGSGSDVVTAVNANVDIKGVANLLLDWADAEGIGLSPMKIQKILFFSNSDLLVSTGQPLFQQLFEAWDYGPVNPSIYKEFKRFKDRPIRGRAHAFDPVKATTYTPRCILEPEVESALRESYDFYKRFSAIALSDLSHSKAGAWRQARSLFANGLNSDRLISTDLIKQCHRIFDS